MRTVTLELLRHGPAHNQLLSPLTPYLALCGNHDTETIQVGLEHLSLTRSLEQLRYQQGRRMATFAMQDAAREVSHLLESIRSLTAELASSDPVEGQRIIHLRLVLSASELALLPFELATSHVGMPGQGQPLALQTVTPVCLTREVRRVAASTLEWPTKPRILMVTAAPREVSAVPAREHEEKLKAALAPYLDMDEPQEIEDHLTVLAEATIEDVREACSKTAYTHIHILAHGIARDGTGDEAKYGLAFHAQQDRNEVDIVSGERLASALRCHMRGDIEQVLSSPVVVSIASCDSANVGAVLAPGASIAHALHEQGIPLVVGSQFPLSVKGSILLVELLYRRLLAGDDPRITVHDLRQALYTACPESHDWASVVVYASLPGNLIEQLQQARFEQANQALNMAMRHTAGVLQKESNAARSRRKGTKPPEPEMQSKDINDLKQQIMQAMERFEEAAPDGQIKTLGTLASARKQIALLLSMEKSLSSPKTKEDPEWGDALLDDEEFRTMLETSRRYYYECYKAGAREAWPLVQYLALTAGLKREKGPGSSKVSKRFQRLWIAAGALARENIRWGDAQQAAWAYGSLMELSVLSMHWRDPKKCSSEAKLFARQAIEHLDLNKYSDAEFDIFSLRRQLRRYNYWGWGTKEMLQLCREIGELIGVD
ncbi:CHAT domain-containing protein [Corallococcus soli]